jgi:hypothetical protein
MAKDLTNDELKIAVSKIKSKYEKLIIEFKKSRVLIDNFEDRYRSALKNRMDLSVFLLAEIEAIEELYNKEKLKKEAALAEKPAVNEEKQSLADKIFEENRQKIQKYSKIDLGTESDEELERLLGAIRDFLNNYFPAINMIYKERRHTAEGEKLNEYYHKLLTQYDFKGEVPITRQYSAALSRLPRDFKKIDFEHRFVMQETAFFLNDILDLLEIIIKRNSVPMPETLLKPQKKDVSPQFYELFNGIRYDESVKLNYDFLNSILIDFRFKGFKKNYKI